MQANTWIRAFAAIGVLVAAMGQAAALEGSGVRTPTQMSMLKGVNAGSPAENAMLVRIDAITGFGALPFKLHAEGHRCPR